MRILILGCTGQVGGMLVEQMSSVTDFAVSTMARRQADVCLDFENLNEIPPHLNEINPDVIINAIAYTAVDKAESEPDVAFRLNTDLPSLLSDWCEQRGKLLIHYSTDFVFNGQKDGPWYEWDECEPLSVYGKSKLAGEKAIQITSASAIILRTSWVFGETGSNFMKTMIKLASERDSLSVVNDQKGCPTYSRDIARASVQLLTKFVQNPEFFAGKQRLYHCCSQGETTWHDFAEAIFSLARKYDSLQLKELRAISTAEYPTPASRPANSVLNCDELNADLSILLPEWTRSLHEAIEHYYSNTASKITAG